MMKRYFIVYYAGNSADDGNYTIGFIEVITSGFLNKAEIIKEVSNQEKLVGVTITGFNEISEVDYQYWIKPLTD